MPIKSTKPARGNFSPGTKPKPYLNHYASEAEITNTSSARSQVNSINSRMLRMTQPYSRAAELRAGNAFRIQQEAAMRAELAGAIPFPQRRMGNVRGGPFRSRPVG